MTQNVIGFVDNIKVGLLGTVGFAILIYSVIAMMQKIERSFNYIWHVTKERSLPQRFSDYLSVLLVGPLLIFLSIGMTTALTSSAASSWLGEMVGMDAIIAVFGRVVPYLILAFAFSFIYIFIPNTKVRFFSAFVGGLVTAVIWKLMGWVFSIFVASSSSHIVIYAAFATLIILMIWLYLGWLVLLIGASIAFYQQYPQNALVKRRKLILSCRMKERLVLAIAYQWAKDFDENRPSMRQEDLAHHLHVPVRAVELAIRLLEKTGLFLHVKQQTDGYVPSRPLTKMYVSDILGAIRKVGEDNVISNKQLALPASVKAHLESTEKTLAKQQKKTLRDLL